MSLHPSVGGGGESAFLERLSRRLPGPPPGEIWHGDDAAVLADGLLLATDVIVEGVHFRLDWCDPEDVGWKALAVNLSDVAAMAGRPLACVAALVLPRGAAGLADRVMDGMARASSIHACPIVGGDTTAGRDLTVSVAVLGRLDEVAGEIRRPVLRRGAQPGDAVFVTGGLGGSESARRALEGGREGSAGGVSRLRRPSPRIAEGIAAAQGGATAMIDLSDGLGKDAGHVCDASRVGIIVDESAIPVAEGATLMDACSGGDDYELWFTAPVPDRVESAFAAGGLASPTAIGSVDDGIGVRLRRTDGTIVPITGGWEHAIL